MRPLRFPDLETSVERRCPAGHVQVVRCYPLRMMDGRPVPFPTLFWLACDRLSQQVSEIERGGAIEELQREIAVDGALRAGISADHLAYSAERWRGLGPDDRRLLEDHGLAAQAKVRGIGGIRDFTRVKCLHLHYAHHLARGSTVGAWLEGRFAITPCP